MFIVFLVTGTENVLQGAIEVDRDSDFSKAQEKAKALKNQGKDCFIAKESIDTEPIHW
jgi:hypothetical protein